MQVEFRTKRLKAAYQESKKAQRAWGPVVAGRYVQRINIVKSAKSKDELVAMPVLRCHPLSGNLDGLHAIDLTGFYRLIVTFEEGVVTIEEVSKHYGD